MPEPDTFHATPEEFHGQPCLRLQWGPQDSLLVALHGAHVLSWIASRTERLYLSPKALFDGHSAIRGGVPVCFPQFNDRGGLPKHGFVRNMAWRAGPAQRDPATGELRLSLHLENDAATFALWPEKFTVELLLTIRPGWLQIGLGVHNTGETSWTFTGALHSYLRVPSLATVRLEGLAEQSFWNGLSNTRGTQSGPIYFDAEFDRVYTAAPHPLTLQQGNAALHIEQSSTFADTVVWNPGAAKCATLADMPADGFEQMVCVEAAQVEQAITLAPGERWMGWQRLSVA